MGAAMNRIPSHTAKSILKAHIARSKGVPIGDVLPQLKPKSIPRAASKGEETLALQLKAEGIKFQREFRFAPPRRWKFDFALGVEHGDIAVEIEGGSWSAGAHTRGKHFEQDCEKYAEAVIIGWRVFRFTTDMVMSGEAIKYILRAI
jgi:very-short-patch-repair endonuclease